MSAKPRPGGDVFLRRLSFTYVFFCSCLGTHWAWEIVTMLLKQRAEYSKEPMECFFLEAMPDFNFVHNLPSPRIFNTHIPIRWFPNQHIENGAKIVHVLRNPKDIAVSMYHHFKNVGMLGDVENFQIFLEKMFMNPKGKTKTNINTEREQEGCLKKC